ncbi:hypothetical protein AC623_10725 [Bacillus sp. FJAT-27231]|uniref:stalk domain-containing protein n=1 Tax=Bacillus sp. FJAT-27231 TaxID=1679168 RepID=UPI000670CDA2|nr:stalk domain-containing protein [Bacillus sp. FJAT-27231]KMY54345.1 hypothetical protein AC623_10725 [Bacillus sp. FJAT-27231]
MKKKMLGKIAVGTLAFSLFGSGVYAGTVVKSYKTPRGDMATVEKEEVHKNRIALEVDGKKVKKSTLYLNGTTYVPLRDTAELLGAKVDYDSKTMAAKIKSSSPHNEQKIIKKSELPYTITSINQDYSFYMVVTIESIEEVNDKTVARIKVTNKSPKNYSFYFDESHWTLYADNKSLGGTDFDDYLKTISYVSSGGMPANKTMEGNITFPKVPAGTKSVMIRFNPGYVQAVDLHFNLNS